jgi:hypothetical protein
MDGAHHSGCVDEVLLLVLVVRRPRVRLEGQRRAPSLSGDDDIVRDDGRRAGSILLEHHVTWRTW